MVVDVGVGGKGVLTFLPLAGPQGVQPEVHQWTS